MFFESILRIVQATNGLSRKRQEMVADLVVFGFKSGPYTNTENKFKIKQQLIKELLNSELIFKDFPHSNVNAEEFLSNLGACQALWGNLKIVISVFDSVNDYVESHHFLDEFLNFTNEFYEKLGFSLLLFLSSLGLNGGNQNPEQRQMQEIQAEQALSILANFAEMIQVFFKSCKSVKGTNSQVMLKLLSMMSILDKLFSLRMGNLSKNDHNIIFEPTLKPQINKILTKYKNNVLDSVKELLEFFNHDGKYMLTKKNKSIKTRQENEKKTQKFLLHLNSVIRLGLNSLIFFFKDPQVKVEDIYLDVDLHTLVVETVGILTNGSYNCEVFGSLAEKKSELLRLVFLPSCVQDSMMLENLNSNEDEYVHRNFYFMSDRRKDYNMRMISIKSLKILCSHLDGFLSEVINLVINTVTISLGHMTVDQITNQQQKMRFLELTQTNFWTEVDTRLKIDSCFLILTELSISVLQRPDLIKKIEDFIKLVFQQLTIQCEDILIITRMILFCGKYMDILFQNEESVLVDIVKWILMNLPLQDVRGCAAELIVFNIMVKDNNKRKANVGEEIKIFTDDPAISSLAIQNLMQRISSTFRPNLIEAFMSLVKLNSSFFVDNPVLFEQYLKNISLIIQEISQENNQEQKSLIGNVWYLVKQVCETKEIYLKYREFIEKTVSDLFPLVDKMDKENNFDSDLIECLVAWNNHSEEVSKYALAFIPYMEKVQNKNEGSLGTMYNLLNNYFIYAKDKFSLQDIQMVLAMALKSINVPEQNENNHPMFMGGVSIAQGFLMIQMIMMNMSHLVPDPTLESIIGMFKTFYLKNLESIQNMYREIDYFDDNYEEIVFQNSQPMFYFDKMMGVFLMGAYLFPEKVLKHFLEFEYSTQIMEEHKPLKFTFIIDLICSRFDEFSSKYDQKLWMMSFSRMIDFFLNSFQESGRQEHLDLISFLVYKSVLVLKSIQLNIKISNEHWNIQKNNRFMDLFMESCDEFNQIREMLKITRSAQNLYNQSSNFFDMYDDDDDEDELNDYNFVEIEKKNIMKDVKSPLLKMDEIEEFRAVMQKVRLNEQVYLYIKNNMPELVKKYFSKVAFEFERVGHRIRNIRKLKPRRKLN